MKKTLFENQMLQLIGLWHEVICLQEKWDFDKMFPNFSELSTTETSIIRMLSENETIMFKEISQRLSIPKSTLTHIINRLEKKEYLQRKISHTDLRSYHLSLTPKGILAQNEHIQCENLVCKQILQALNSDKEREQFLSLLKIITSNMKSKEPYIFTTTEEGTNNHEKILG